MASGALYKVDIISNYLNTLIIRGGGGHQVFKEDFAKFTEKAPKNSINETIRIEMKQAMQLTKLYDKI